MALNWPCNLRATSWFILIASRLNNDNWLPYFDYLGYSGQEKVFVLLIRKPMLKMVRTIIKQLAIIAWTLGLLIQAQSSLSQPGAQPTAQLLDQKVLLIGLDGLMYSYIDDVDDPELDEPTLTHFPKFALTKAFVGGYLNTASHQISSSGPSWTSILTGTWTDQHGVVSNNGAHAAVPGIFSRLHTRNPALNFGSFSAWSDINTGHLVKDMAFVKRRVDGASRPEDLSVDEFVTRAVIEELSGQGSDLDFVFLHLDEIDGAGHDCGHLEARQGGHGCPHWPAATSD